MPQGIQSVFPPRRGLNTRHVEVYDDFSAGEYGTLGPHAPPRSFTGTNIIRYLDGSIGPRSGLKSVPVTGLPVGVVTGFGPGYNADTVNSNYVIIGTGVYGINGESGGAAVAYTGSLSAASSGGVAINATSDQPFVTYFAVPGNRCYAMNHATRTVSALTGSPAGTSIVIYGDRMMVANSAGSPPNRLVFSAAADYNTWPARNYVDIGDGAAINGLFVFRNRLYISKNFSWYQLTGVPGVNDTVRHVLNVPYEFAISQHDTVCLPNTAVWFVPSYEDFPGVFDGLRIRTLRHLTLGTGFSLSSTPPTLSMTHLPPRSDEVAMLRLNQVLLNMNSTWTRHSLTATINGSYVSVPTGSNGNGRLVLSDGGAAGAAANFWVWKVGDMTRPPLVGQTYESVGDASSTWNTANVTMPEWWDPTGNFPQARVVMVDFTKYSTGVSQTNHFDVAVDALRLYGSSGSTSSGTQSFDEAPTGGTTGVRQMMEFGFGEQGPGAGFQVRLSNIRGVKIHRIAVTVDLHGPRTI